jgi:hypothetical protein
MAKFRTLHTPYRMLDSIKTKLGAQVVTGLVSDADEDGPTIRKAIQTECPCVDNGTEELPTPQDTHSPSPAEENPEFAHKCSTIENNDALSNLAETSEEVENASSSVVVMTPATPLTISTLILPDDIDTRHPYRLGWPLLASQPVHTSRDQVPKILSPKRLHLGAIHQILATHKIKVASEQEVEVVHRHNPGKQIGKSTLTLLIPTPLIAANKIENEQAKTRGEENKKKLEAALLALRTYITTHALRLSIEFVHPSILLCLYTIPILAHDPLYPLITKRKHGIKTILNECGGQWTSLDFYYRGYGPTRNECRATLLIGVPEPERRVWWEDGGVVERIRDRVAERIRDRVAGMIEVEVRWWEAVKF